MGVRSGLTGVLLGSLLTAVHLMILPVWLGWPAAVLLGGVWSKCWAQEKLFDLTWFLLGSFLPLYCAVL